MSRPFSSRTSASANSFIRVNGKIRAREVRVVGDGGQQLGVLPLGEAINLARSRGVDLVEIAPNATPPVCRIVDYGKFRYEQSKKDKEAKKHQHATKVKEVQLSPKIDPHDFGVKLNHAIDFLCEDMKVKITLRFRGREMAHQEYGFQVVERFIQQIIPYGHPDAPAKLIGKGITVMVSPLPRNKRAKHPRVAEDQAQAADPQKQSAAQPTAHKAPSVRQLPSKRPAQVPTHAAEKDSSDFSNKPFDQLDIKLGS